MALIKISACLVLHNEENLIIRCLDSLKDVVDEIIVVHDGPCIDQTLVIAAKYGARIFEREFIGEAEPHRPFSFAQARGDWILQIDADEYLSPKLQKNLRILAENKNIAAYEFIWPIWNGKKIISSLWPKKRCFFRRDKISFLGLPHFVVAVASPLVLNHEPNYDNYQCNIFKTKWLPWAQIQARYYLKDFTAIAKFNYNHNDWPRQIIIRRSFPLLVLPFDAILVFARTLCSGAYRLGLAGFKVALIHGAYRAAIDYYLIKIKQTT